VGGKVSLVGRNEIKKSGLPFASKYRGGRVEEKEKRGVPRKKREVLKEGSYVTNAQDNGASENNAFGTGKGERSDGSKKKKKSWGRRGRVSLAKKE